MNADERGFATSYLRSSAFIRGSKYLERSKHGN